MKKIFVFITSILILSTGISQAVFTVSKKISSEFIIRTGNTFQFNADSVEILASYLKAFLPDSSKNNTALGGQQVLAKFKNNPFIGKEISMLLNRSGASVISSGLVSNALSSIGGITIPNEILLGVTDWIVKRTKQELNVFFFEDFKTQIEKYPDLKTVFQQTYQILVSIGDEIYNYPRYLKSLRLNFQLDLKQLAKNLPSIIDNHPDFYNKHPELAATLKSGLYIANGLQEKIHPGDILNDYPVEYLNALHPDWKAAIQTLQLISYSLRETISGNVDARYWVNPSDVHSITADKINFRIFLGLVYQTARVKFESIGFENKNGKTSLVEMMDQFALQYDSVYTKYSDFITRFSEKTQSISILLKKYKSTGTDSSSFQMYFDYYNEALDLFQICTELSRLPFIKEKIPDLSEQLKDYFEVARSTSDLVFNIKQHNYSTSISNIIHIYELVKVKQGNADADNSSLSKFERELAATFAQVKIKMLRYGSFIAQISEAHNPDEVQNIIESFALPQGSSRIKRQSVFNVALNAYCGLYAGNEVIKGYDQDKVFKGFNSAGLTAPIGFAISAGGSVWPWLYPWPAHVNGFSSSLFISLMDLGAVASYRFTNDSVAQVPSVKIRDIFSPGIFWSVGLPKCPLSLNIGAQFGSNLRAVHDDKNDYSNHSYIRYSVSLCVDLPVLNLYNKSN